MGGFSTLQMQATNQNGKAEFRTQAFHHALTVDLKYGAIHAISTVPGAEEPTVRDWPWPPERSTLTSTVILSFVVGAATAKSWCNINMVRWTGC